MRGRAMVDTIFQGNSGNATHQAIMSSDEYLSQAQRNFNNMEDGYYISPAFLDKVRIHPPPMGYMHQRTCPHTPGMPLLAIYLRMETSHREYTIALLESVLLRLACTTKGQPGVLVACRCHSHSLGGSMRAHAGTALYLAPPAYPVLTFNFAVHPLDPF